MRKFLALATAAFTTGALALGSAAALAQPADAPPTIQTQANPTGAGVPATENPNPTTAAEPVAPAYPAASDYKAGPYKGALTPPPTDAMGKAYPPCSKTVQDGCRNRGGV